ncbi:hypothetical protein M9H77_14391 [Catharanthus roseus]|uniref:Uncharacterized protein n=1 Tax=Catharanthus roseus TaxID=4058 RepID=A0ACC0BN50_CATRO|nr:hypothetical protein M9H77_14391 [Catharanthus roseus]
MGSGEPIDDLIEFGTLRLLDWNDSMTDIQLGMRFIDKVQEISAVQKWSIRMGREYRVVKKIPVLNVIQEVQVLFQMGCTYKRAWYARKFATERIFSIWETTFNILPKYPQAMQD